jgi:hypothetical protein
MRQGRRSGVIASGPVATTTTVPSAAIASTPLNAEQLARGMAPTACSRCSASLFYLVGRTGFEPVTSSVSVMAIVSDEVLQGRVTAVNPGSAVRARRVGAGYAWRRCRLVSHWLAGPSSSSCLLSTGPLQLNLSLLFGEPPATGDERWDALLAALAEHLAVQHDLAVPEWHEVHVLQRPWFPAELEVQRADALMWAPTVFRKHGVYLSARDLEAAGPSRMRHSPWPGGDRASLHGAGRAPGPHGRRGESVRRGRCRDGPGIRRRGMLN